MKYAIDVNNLVKIFGDVVALNGISFRVASGEIYGLIGPNGAGKTTTLRILATLIKPTRGHAKIYGLDVVRDEDKIRRMISYLPEEAGAYKYLTGHEYLKFMASFISTKKYEVERMVMEAANISGLKDRLNDKIKTYSKGMRRRLLVARTLMFKPKVAILDEPTGGLDVIHAVHVRKLIRKYARSYNMTVLISSHNMLEVEYLCDRIGLIYKGKIIVEGSPKDILKKYGSENLEEVFTQVIKRHG